MSVCTGPIRLCSEAGDQRLLCARTTTMPLYAEITYPPDVDWTAPAHGAEVAGYGASAAAMRRHAIGGA